ncbi:MAG: efflux RND transporter periplasmic adaptor subunit [Patescibacteria group bacterium]
MSTFSLIQKIPRVSIKKIKSYILAHKIISGIALVLVLGSTYFAYAALTSTAGETRYVLGSVTKGTIVASVSASGQVSTSNQIDIKPKVSGEIVWVGVKAGDKVYGGQGLIALDNTDAKRAVISAEQSLAASKLQLQKDEAAAPIDYEKQADALATAKEDLKTEYNDTYNTLSNTYLDLPSVMTGLQSALYGYDISPNGGQWNVDALSNMFTDSDELAKMKVFADTSKADYTSARTMYDAGILKYKATTRSSSESDIETLLVNSIETTTAVAQALQSELNLLGAAADLAQLHDRKLPAVVTTMQTNARNYLTTVNSDLSALLAEKKALTNAKQTIKTDEQNLTLLQVGNPNGSDPISLQISKNSLETQEANLENLKETLAKYTVTAPFDGVLASVSAKKGDTASGAIASIITTQKIATISLNEVDAAKVTLGDKATLTFDAIDSLTLTGKVSEIDAVGTVSQGVVSYNLKITFDTQDERVKPGMTVNATIQSDTKQNVLIVPSSAVKTQNGVSYIQRFNPPLSETASAQGVMSKNPPEQVEVVTGISDDTNVEIISGVSENDQIVTRTILPGAATTQSAARTTTGRNLGGSGATQVRF